MRTQIIFILLLAVSISVWADVQPCVPVVDAAFDQMSQIVVPDDAGGAIVAWSDARAGGWDIYVQRVDTNGIMQWTTNGLVVCNQPGDQNQLSMIKDGSGGAIMTWLDNRQGNTDIYTQRVDANGNMLWTSNGVVISADPQVQSPPKIATDGSGGAFITWSDNRNTNYDVFAKHINANGTITAPTFSTSSANDEFEPTICSDLDGGAIITYEKTQTLSGKDIFAQRINSGCAAQWGAAGLKVSSPLHHQRKPQIVNAGFHTAIIVWEDPRIGDVTYDLYAQRVDDTGTTWTNDGVIVTASVGDHFDPTINSSEPNSVIVVWEELGQTGDTNIFAQKISGTTTGTAQWTANGVSVTSAAGDQLSPKTAIDGTGGVYIVWQDLRSGSDIYGQHVDADGNILGIFNGFGICDEIGTQQYPMLANNTPGEVVVTWMDFRNGSDWDIYTLFVDEEITLPVELSSLTATITSDLCVTIAWITQSETNHSGYNILRSEGDQISSAIKINPSLIDDGTALGTQISYSYTDQEAYSNMVYYYWLESISLDGLSEYFGPLAITIGDPALEPLPPVNPLATKLLNAFPNPFNPNTNIRYSLKQAGKVTIDIYTVKGQKVRSFKAEHSEPGYYQISWDGHDANGSSISSGIYLYRMTSGSYSSSKKMILVK